MEQLVIKLLNMSFTASYVALFVLVIRFFIRKMPKFYSYLLWSLVFFHMVSPFTIKSSLSLLKINVAPISKDIIYSEKPTIHSKVPFIDESVNTILEESLPLPQVEESINPIQIVLSIGGAIWLLGMGILIGYTFFTWMRLKLKLATAIKVEDGIFESERVGTPFILGLINPIIYLPRNLEKNTKEYVLAHERYHLKRKDYIIKSLFYVGVIIHWFNPIIWLSFYMMTQDMEMSCDEGVIKDYQIEEKKAYSKSLLEVGTRKRYFKTPVAFSENHVKSRVKNVLTYHKPTIYISSLIVLGGIGISIGLLTTPKEKVAPPKLIIDSIYVYENQAGGPPHWFYEIDKGTRDRFYKLFESVEWKKVSDNIRYDFMLSIEIVDDIKGRYVICNNIEGKMYMEVFTPDTEIKRYFAPSKTYEDILFILDEQEKTKYDEAYIRMWKEENYIIDLIESISKKETSLSNWKDNLSYLQENYEKLMNLDGVNKQYIDSYIEAYKLVSKYEEEVPTSKESTSQKDGDDKQLLNISEQVATLIENNLALMVNDRKITVESARNENAYQDILKQGEEALNYMLNQFKEKDQDNKKGYIMMFLCKDLLGERDSVKDMSLRPNEWYSALKIKKQSLIEDYVYEGDDIFFKLVYDHELARTRNSEGFTVIAPEIIEVVQEKNKVKIFFMSFSLSFVLYETELYDKAGSIVPGALTYTINEDGSYTLDKVEYAQDGSHHLSSIKEFCISPVEKKEIEGLASRMLYTGDESIHQLMEENLKKHLKAQGLKNVKWYKAGGEIISLS